MSLILNSKNLFLILYYVHLICGWDHNCREIVIATFFNRIVSLDVSESPNLVTPLESS